MSGKRSHRARMRDSAKPVKPSLTKDSVKALESALNYTFKNKDLLTRAMTHPGAVSSQDAAKRSNQRLEFLGDRVLGLIISERLMERYPTEREGKLAPRFNAYVRKEACADAVRHLGIGDYLIMAEHDAADGGRTRDSALGDLCEAVIAAVYLDGGLKSARALIERAWAPQFAHGVSTAKDAKTALQEWAQGRGLSLPHYEVIDRTGPDHAPEFKVSVKLDNGYSAEAIGTSKQDAQRAAAEALLEQLENE